MPEPAADYYYSSSEMYPLATRRAYSLSSKHLLRRLNDTIHVSDRAPQIHANTLRRHKVRTVITISSLAPLGLAVPALQNVAKMPVNHQASSNESPEPPQAQYQ